MHLLWWKQIDPSLLWLKKIDLSLLSLKQIDSSLLHCFDLLVRYIKTNNRQRWVNRNCLVWFMWKNQSISKRYIFLSSISVLHNASFPRLYWILRKIHGLQVNSMIKMGLLLKMVVGLTLRSCHGVQVDPLYSCSCSIPLVFVVSDHFPSLIFCWCIMSLPKIMYTYQRKKILWHFGYYHDWVWLWKAHKIPSFLSTDNIYIYMCHRISTIID